MADSQIQQQAAYLEESIKGPAIECPKCGKYSVIRMKGRSYKCLNCSFERNLSGPGVLGSISSAGSLVLICLVLFVIWLL